MLINIIYKVQMKKILLLAHSAGKTQLYF